MHELSWTNHLLLLPLMVLFFIAALAETNRHPFDMPESEADLVSGYHVEYSSMLFALFFLGEYANMMIMSALLALFFLGGFYPPFNLPWIILWTRIPGIVWLVIKIIFILFFFILVRGSIPRYRYDQLMRLGWKFFLPFSILWFILMASVKFFGLV